MHHIWIRTKAGHCRRCIKNEINKNGAHICIRIDFNIQILPLFTRRRIGLQVQWVDLRTTFWANRNIIITLDCVCSFPFLFMYFYYVLDSELSTAYLSMPIFTCVHSCSSTHWPRAKCKMKWINGERETKKKPRNNSLPPVQRTNNFLYASMVPIIILQVLFR